MSRNKFILFRIRIIRIIKLQLSIYEAGHLFLSKNMFIFFQICLRVIIFFYFINRNHTYYSQTSVMHTFFWNLFPMKVFMNHAIKPSYLGLTLPCLSSYTGFSMKFSTEQHLNLISNLFIISQTLAFLFINDIFLPSLSKYLKNLLIWGNAMMHRGIIEQPSA